MKMEAQKPPFLLLDIGANNLKNAAMPLPQVDPRISQRKGIAPKATTARCAITSWFRLASVPAKRNSCNSVNPSVPDHLRTRAPDERCNWRNALRFAPFHSFCLTLLPLPLH